MKKVGKTTTAFRHDLNQIPYDYTMEVTNRFKGLDLIDRVPEEPWTEVHDVVQEAGQVVWYSHFFQNFPTIEKYIDLNAEFQRIATRDKKTFLSDQCKEIEENNRMGKTRDPFKKISDTKGTFHSKRSTIKDKSYGPNRSRRY